jgi:hypothetical protein
MNGGIPPLPNTPSWRGTQLKHRDNFTSTFTDQPLAEMIQVVSNTLCSEIHKFINSVWNKEELPQLLESIIVPIYKKGDKTDCCNYREISLLPTTYKTLYSVPSLKPNVTCRQNYWDRQYGFQWNRSSTDEILCIHQTLYRKWEYNGKVYQLFTAFYKAYDSVRREVLYNILTEFGVSMKLVRLIKMCLNEPYDKVCIGKNLSDPFPIWNGLK